MRWSSMTTAPLNSWGTYCWGKSYLQHIHALWLGYVLITVNAVAGVLHYSWLWGWKGAGGSNPNDSRLSQCVRTLSFEQTGEPQHSFTHSRASIPIISASVLTRFPPWLPFSNNINWDSFGSHACLWKRVVSTSKIYTCKPVPPVGLKVHTQLAQLTRFLINLAACERCKSRFFFGKGAN